jgi:hypothetical protein
MGLSDAYNAFDAQGKLKDEKTKQRLYDIIGQFIAHLKKA